MTYATSQDLFDQQIALEEESVSLGQERYWKRLDRRVKAGTEDETAPALSLIERSIDAVAEAFEFAMAPKKSAGRRNRALAYVEGIEPGALAFIALRGALACVSRPQTYVQTVRRVAGMVLDEINFRAFKRSDERGYKFTQEHIKKHNDRKSPTTTMRHMAAKRGVTMTEWSAETTAYVGAWMMENLIEATGLFCAPKVKKNGKSVMLFSPTQELTDHLLAGHERASLFCPVLLPMVVPPSPWTSPTEGGYLTTAGGRRAMVKSHNRSYIESLGDVDMPQVYEAINSIQSTGWQINRAVLDVAREMWNRALPVAGLPLRDPEPLPAEPVEYAGRMHVCRKENFELYKSWAIRASAVHDSNNRLFSKRLTTQEKINIADKFAGYEAIFFPHVLDFRGRIYPLPATMSPQGDDLSKGLLRFAEGKLMTERGYWWLRVHIANCFGVDKVSFEERVAWTDGNIDKLLESAIDPIHGLRFWAEADDPFQALAACFELAGYNADPEGHVSHLSIPMDGTCNGLQNFSALLRDPVGGKATNLVPNDKPSDIYAEVAKLVAEQVAKDAVGGNAFALVWEGKITRKIVKQPVMTLPYGATLSGMRSQIEDAMKKNYPGLFATKDTWAACGYLADIVYDCIGKVVVAARQAMDWLREVAKVAAAEDYPIRWTSPVGFPVLQDYRSPVAHNIDMHVNGKRLQLRLASEGDKLDRRRQSSGISPNLIHSFDASHLMHTVNIAGQNGITAFACIHDSYGTHAADTDTLHACIREAFIEQYTPALLTEFADEVRSQVSDEAAKGIPTLPDAGALELSVVRESRYFFA